MNSVTLSLGIAFLSVDQKSNMADQQLTREDLEIGIFIIEWKMKREKLEDLCGQLATTPLGKRPKICREIRNLAGEY